MRRRISAEHVNFENIRGIESPLAQDYLLRFIPLRERRKRRASCTSTKCSVDHIVGETEIPTEKQASLKRRTLSVQKEDGWQITKDPSPSCPVQHSG
jgi:hypothetical protein